LAGAQRQARRKTKKRSSSNFKIGKGTQGIGYGEKQADEDEKQKASKYMERITQQQKASEYM
jgi:hypothetical protein